MKSILIGSIVVLAFIVSPAWASLGEDVRACEIGILAQNNYGYTDQYGYDHNQMHYQMHGGSGGGGCGGGGGHYMNHYMGNYQQNLNDGYQDPNYRNYDPSYQNNGEYDNHYHEGHHH